MPTLFNKVPETVSMFTGNGIVMSEDYRNYFKSFIQWFKRNLRK